MGKNLYTAFEIKELEKNPNVLHVSEHAITYDLNFKLQAVQEYNNGKIPSQIFIENGFKLEIVGKRQPQKCLSRWRKTFEKYGEAGFDTERRGKASSGRPSLKELSVVEKLKRAEAKLKFLEVENEFLKKLDQLERQALKKNR